MLVRGSQDYDESRKRDIVEMERRINDPNCPPDQVAKAKELLYAFKHQRDDPNIVKLREDMRKATLNGDQKRTEELAEKARTIDKDYHL